MNHEICFPLVIKSLSGYAVISRIQFKNENSFKYTHAALKCKTKTEKDCFDLTNLFFKTRFCKYQWKSIEVIRFATPWTTYKETRVTRSMQQAQGRVQEHCCSYSSAVHRVLVPWFYTHLTALEGLYVS